VSAETTRQTVLSSVAGESRAVVDRTLTVAGREFQARAVPSRSVHAKLSFFIQQLRFVPPWLLSRQTDTHTRRYHFDWLI